MKRVWLFSRRFVLMTSLVAVSALAFTSCDKNDDDVTTTNRMYNLSGNASGSQMVPAVAGNGTATLTGTYNADTKTMNYTTNWSGLSGAVTSGGFYGGATGQNGAAIGSAWNLGTTTGGAGTFTGQMTLTDEQATQLTGGNWYYTLGTATNTNGEIRGQVTATPQ